MQAFGNRSSITWPKSFNHPAATRSAFGDASHWPYANEML